MNVFKLRLCERVSLPAGLCAALLSAALPVLAQTIPVTTPRLPPRTATAGQAAAQAGAQPAAYAGFTPQSSVYAGAGAQPSSYASPAPQANAYGAGGPAYAAPAMVAPERAPPGACRAQPTPDRQTLVLVSGTEALARQHLPLGEFRAQQVVHSPDGRWAVAYTKLRGALQYAAMTIDLERCEVQRVIDLGAAGEDVRFEGDEAVLRLSDGERRVALRDGRVR